MEWITRTDRPLTEVEKFINNFMTAYGTNEIKLEVLRATFRSGYCWHFAHMLKDTFNRGIIVWAAPFGHICWQDIDGKNYDVEGEYEGEAFYFIPETFTEVICPGSMFDFKHIPDKSFNITKQDLIKIMKSYCDTTNMPYDKRVETYLRNDVTKDVSPEGITMTNQRNKLIS